MKRTGISGIFAASLELAKRVLFQFHKKNIRKTNDKKLRMKKDR